MSRMRDFAYAQASGFRLQVLRNVYCILNGAYRPGLNTTLRIIHVSYMYVCWPAYLPTDPLCQFIDAVLAWSALVNQLAR